MKWTLLLAVFLTACASTHYRYYIDASVTYTYHVRAGIEWNRAHQGEVVNPK